MRRDEGGPFVATSAGGKNHQTERPRGQLSSRSVLFGVLALVAATAFAGVLLSCAPVTATPTLHRLPLTPTQSGRDGMWHDVGLSANAQIVFSRSAPQVAYSCDVVNKTIVMHVTHDGGMSWQPLASVTPIISEICILAVDETNPQHLALLTLVTKVDPCMTTACTPTPCASACEPCVDSCSSPPQRIFTLYQSVDGGVTWKSSSPLPNGVHFTPDIAFAGSTLYAWTDTWPTLLAVSAAGGSWRLINLSAFFPDPRNTQAYLTYQTVIHLWPLRGQLYVPVPGGEYTNHYIVTNDGGLNWTRSTFTMDGDPVVLRPNSGLDGRTLMGERIHSIGHLVLSTDGGNTWQAAPAPSPDFSHLGLIQCYVASDGSFIWFNGFDPGFGLGVYRAGTGATAWTKILDATHIQDISVDLVSYDASGHVAALWGRKSRTEWVIYRLL